MNGSKLLLSAALLLFFVSSQGTATFESDGVLGKIKSGFEMAGKFLGLDHASGVAQLVASAFGKNSRQDEVNNYKSDIFSGFLRVLGFDSRRIGAIAVNAIIFVAQLISSSLAKKKANRLQFGRKIQNTLANPLDLAMGTHFVSGLIKNVRHDDISAALIQDIQENSVNENTGCVQLLICKSTPLIHAMQKALRLENIQWKKGKAALYEYIPSRDDWELNGDDCDKKFPYCRMFV